MPTYEHECNQCGNVFDLTLKISELQKTQQCPECASEDTKRNITSANFILVGDDWPGKSIRVNGQMHVRRDKVGIKEEEQKKDAPLATLIPNVDGEETDTWAEAQSLAKDKGKDTSTYEPVVRKEQSGDL